MSKLIKAALMRIFIMPMLSCQRHRKIGNSNNRDVHCPYDDHPHLTIIETFRNFFSDYMTEENQVFYEKLNEKLQKLFDLEAQSPGIYSGGEYGIHCSVCSYWYDGLIQNDGMPINGVEEFLRGSKYLASLCNCGWDGETIWSQSWNFSDEICPYDFPAVFYSVTELHAWFVWALKNACTFFLTTKNA